MLSVGNDNAGRCVGAEAMALSKKPKGD
jgi:hypothetical protein